MKTSTGAIVVLDELSPGNVFGTLAAIDRKQRGANCIAMSSVVVGRIAMLDFQVSFSQMIYLTYFKYSKAMVQLYLSYK